ncbi:MAG: hypothetical protein RL417_1631 [Pseudomonadota bacterium]|jgi:O-antigen/teichoic acid export membrane protein
MRRVTVSRRVFSGAGYLFLGQGAARLLSILTVPILSHLIAPEGYGVAALITTALSLGSVFALVGIDMSYARLYSAKTPPCGDSVESFCWRFALGSGLVWAVIAAVLWLLVVPRWISVPSGYATVVALGVFLLTVQTITQTRARLQGRFKHLAAVLFTAAVSGAVGAILLASNGMHDERPLVAAMIITAFIGICGLGIPPARLLFQPSGLTRQERRGVVGIGLFGVITAPAYWLLSSSDRWFLSSLAGSEAAGVYAVSASIGIAGLTVSHALFGAWLPEALKEYERDPVTALPHLVILQRRIILVLGSVWLLVASLGTEAIHILAAPPFHAGAPAIPWLAGGVFFYGFFHLANAGLLISKRATRVIGWWIAGGAFSVILNLWLIPRWGGVGAAIAQCLAFGLVGCGSMLMSRAVLPLPLGGRLYGALVGFLILGYPLTGMWGDAPLMSAALKLPLLGIGPMLLVYIVEPSLIRVLLQRGRIRLYER